MPTFKRPGVYTSESLVPSTPGAQPPSSTIAAFVGPYNRGPANGTVSTPVLLTSWTDFVNNFGGFGGNQPGVVNSSKYLAQGVYQYFLQGGKYCYVTRVVNATSAAATRILVNGVPNNVLTVTALNNGAWGNNIFVEVANVVSTRFDVNIYFGGSTQGFLVERWTDLSMTLTDSRYAPAIINSTVAGSKYVVVTDMNTGTTNTPIALAASALSTGADGATAWTGTDMAAYRSAFAAALLTMDTIPDPLTVVAPGETDPTNITALLNYVDPTVTSPTSGLDNRFAVLDTPPLTTAQDVKGTGTATTTAAGAVSYAAGLSTASAYAAVYWPWVTVLDPSVSTPNATVQLPPSAMVAGEMSYQDVARGVFKAPAGTTARLKGAVGVAFTTTPGDQDTLNVGNVNAVRVLPGAGIVLFGARTLNTSTSAKYIPIRRTLNVLKTTLRNSTQFAVFEPNDVNLWNSVRSVCEQVLFGLFGQGAFAGSTPGAAFYVVCDASNNTPATVAQGLVNIEVGVALQYPAEFISIRISQWTGGQTTQEV